MFGCRTEASSVGNRSLPAVREYSYRLAPNWYVSPNFDSVQMLHDFAQQLNGGGGSVEQTHVYLDQGALDWIQLRQRAKLRRWVSREHAAQRNRQTTPQKWLVRSDSMCDCARPGDGKAKFVSFSSYSRMRASPICVHLFDVSQPLRSEGSNMPWILLVTIPNVFVCGMGQLPPSASVHAASLHAARSHRRRVYDTGDTTQQHRQQAAVLSSAFAGRSPGFITGAGYAFGCSGPRFHPRPRPIGPRPTGSSALACWSPFHRYEPTFQVRLVFRFGSTPTALCGGYGLQFIASRSFSRNFKPGVLHVAESDATTQPVWSSLSRDLGWEPIGQIPFSGSRPDPHQARLHVSSGTRVGGWLLGDRRSYLCACPMFFTASVIRYAGVGLGQAGNQPVHRSGRLRRCLRRGPVVYALVRQRGSGVDSPLLAKSVRRCVTLLVDFLVSSLDRRIQGAPPGEYPRSIVSSVFIVAIIGTTDGKPSTSGSDSPTKNQMMPGVS